MFGNIFYCDNRCNLRTDSKLDVRSGVKSEVIMKYSQCLNQKAIKTYLALMLGMFLAAMFFTPKLFAAELKIIQPDPNKQKPQQGSMIVARVIGNADVYLNNKKLEQTDDKIVVFGVGRDAQSQIKLTLKHHNKNKVDTTQTIMIEPRKWKIERVNGLPPTKISPKKPAVLKRINQENSLVKKARNIVSKQVFFNQKFILPAQGRISGVYGSQRVLNGEPKRPHFGLDIANKTGTPIVAPANGIVRLAHNNMFYSGGTLIIDHGFGISTTYIHLSKIDVKQNQVVKQGEKIAEIGQTGRATGPHLDWRLNWFNTRLDPALLLD
jgi:murein DD-endopeptidase MepM/ murein hydrolase activator NlpD